MLNGIQTGPKIPPPPTEVGIRTMASDLEAIKASGGQPEFVNAAVPQSVRSKINWAPIFWILGAIAIAALFVLIGYYFLFPLLK